MPEEFMGKQIEHVIAQIPVGKSVKINLHDLAIESGLKAEDIMKALAEIEKGGSILVTELLKGTVMIKRKS